MGLIASLAFLFFVSEVSGAQTDWLVRPLKDAARIRVDGKRGRIDLGNDLIRRTFVTRPNFATIDYANLMTGATVIRGVKPEAVVVIDGRRFEIGGLKGQPDYAYLDPEWIGDLEADPGAFQFVDYDIGKPLAPYPWKRTRHAAKTPWPPRGVALTVRSRAPENAGETFAGIVVEVHYELYEGIPVLAKWVAVENGTQREIVVDSVESEILAVTEQEKPRLHVESDYAFSQMVTTHWGPDPDYKTQIDYHYQMPVLMTSRYPLGPDVHFGPGERFESFRTFELLYDSDDRERQGLERRRMMRTVAPQVTENPIFMHVRNSDRASLRRAIDQAADVGFEMVILTFGSGFNIESEDPSYIARFKEDVEYARARGVEIGGYTLMCASRNVGAKYNCISPETGKPGSRFGQSACLASEWADGYFRRVLNFLDATGMMVIETDGPYHGDVCASTKHKHHRGREDSQWAQWRACVGFYHKLRERGVYINTPDQYYLNGSNKCAMGYRETNFSLPRWRQILIARQNIFDGTFRKTPSMGWMFVPLVQYHGGGAAATMEPLSQHLLEYEWHLAQNFGSGVMAAYRGPRLYDAPETREVVKRWVDFYKKYRRILDSDIIHVKRADGKGIDCMMHANAQSRPRGLAMVYNPTNAKQKTTLELPLYFTGLTGKAKIREREGRARRYRLDREYKTRVPITLEPKEITYLVVE